MRITNQMIQQRRIREMLKGQERLENTQIQVSTGKRVTKPSDDPAAINSLLRLRGESVVLAQRKSGLADAGSHLTATEKTLGDMAGYLRQAKNLALQSNLGTVDAAQREVLAGQIERLRDQLFSAANTSQNNRTLFGGTATGDAPFLAGPPVSYQGNVGRLSVEVTTGSLFDISVSGVEVMDSRDGTDLFANLTRLADAIRSGDTTVISTSMDRLDADSLNVTALRGDAGARLQYLEMAQDRTDAQMDSVKAQQSALEDVDIAEAILNEKAAETAQQAALAMSARLGSLSLLDYLR
jgi:flagellar hook-associated protein 3 FlgL